MATATALREKEAKEKADRDTNSAALGKEIAAIEAGMTGSFIQTPAAKSLELLAFLSGAQNEGNVPASGEIVVILKQMNDTTSAGLEEATKEEGKAVEYMKDPCLRKQKKPMHSPQK